MNMCDVTFDLCYIMFSTFYRTKVTHKMTGPNGEVAKSLANGLVGTKIQLKAYYHRFTRL